jgi:hypothetical protein
VTGRAAGAARGVWPRNPRPAAGKKRAGIRLDRARFGGRLDDTQ